MTSKNKKYKKKNKMSGKMGSDPHLKVVVVLKNAKLMCRFVGLKTGEFTEKNILKYQFDPTLSFNAYFLLPN